MHMCNYGLNAVCSHLVGLFFFADLFHWSSWTCRACRICEVLMSDVSLKFSSF